MSGIGDLFYQLGRGGKQIREDYRQTLDMEQADTDYKTGRAQEALSKAAIAADQRLQREKMADATRSAYGDGNENLADLASTSALAGVGNIAQSTQATQNVSDLLMQLAARNAAMKGNYREQNAQLAAIDGKPIQHVKITDGVQFDPYDPAIAPATTAPGAAMVAARNATAGSRNASADASRARADLYRHPSAAKPVTDEANELELARKALQSGAARDKVIARLRERGFGHLANKL